MRSEFQFLEKAELCELKEKILTKYLQHGARNTVKRGFHKAAQVIQSSMNLRIVGYKIVCNIFHSCNSIIIIQG